MRRTSVVLITLFAAAALALIWYFIPLLGSREADRAELVREPPPVSSDDPVIGPETATVTIIEFGDFQCIFCKASHDELTRVRMAYPNEVRLVWKDFPDTSSHAHALSAAVAARCAKDQGKFWEYHDLLFANQELLSPTLYEQIAQELQLNMAQFQACQRRPTPAVVGRDVQEGLERGVSSLPHFFINSFQKSGSVTYNELDAIIQDILNEQSAL